MDSAVEKDARPRPAPNFETTTLAHPSNTAGSFVGKLVQVSTYFSRKIPLYQNYKPYKVKYSSTEAFDC